MDDPQPVYGYDELPYVSRPKPETHPAHLASLAALHGLSPASPQHCRVLELACGDGGNLIPMAFSLPASDFVGLDLGARHIESASARIETLALRNISLRREDIRAFHVEAGTVDYLIAHGVYSWVQPDVRRRILELCAEALSPAGVAYISYNVLPGWRLRSLVRDIARYHTDRTGGALAERAREARRFLAKMERASRRLRFDALPGADYRAFQRILHSENELLGARDDWYLAHELLEDSNEPLYFHDFVSGAEASGLRYLCEARFEEMTYSHYPRLVIELLEPVRHDLVAREQYLDFLRLRTFRQSLLCLADARPSPPAPQRLRDLRIACQARFSRDEVDIRSRSPETIEGISRDFLAIADPLEKAAITWLSERYPATATIEELIDAAREIVAPGPPLLQSGSERDSQRSALCELFFSLFSFGLAELTAAPDLFVTTASDMPCSSSLARVQAENGPLVANLRHEAVELDDEVTRQLLLLLDGTRDRTVLLHELAMRVADGVFTLSREGEPITGDEPFMAALEEALDRHLDRLARAALLTC